MLALIRIALKILLPALVLGGFILVGKHLLDTAPEQPRRTEKVSPTQVEVLTLAPQQYQVRLTTSGRIQAAVTSTLAAEVKGRITQVSPQFHVGGRVKKGDVLIEVNDTDYQQSLIIVKAELAQAQLAVEQGDAERDQVLRDRALLGLSDKPSNLALREPQRKSNQAALAAAKARVAQARTQLTRATITAPFDGQITDTKVNIGQYVNSGTIIVELVGTEKLEVRLPLSDSQLAFVNTHSLESNPLSLSLKAGNNIWPAKLTRQEGIVDSQSLQQMVIAEVSPITDDTPPLTLGLFVTAEIEAELLQDVFVIPRSAVRNNNEIQVVTHESKLHNVQINSIWADEENFIVANKNGAVKTLVKRPIALAADGIEVFVVNENNE